MSSKGKAKEKAAPLVSLEPEPPPAREIVAGKLNEADWLSLLGSSEGVEAASQLVDEVFELAYSVVYAHYLEEQAVPYTVSQAKHSLLQIIEWQFLTRDEGERDTLNDPSWTQDEEPVASVVDSWARGLVHHTSSTNLESSSMAADPPLIIRDLPPSPADNEGERPAREPSRPATTASRLESSVGYTLPSASRKKASQRARPVARPPRARLVPLPPTITVEAPSDDRQPGTTATQSQSSLRSATPPSEEELAGVAPPPFPYGMKPVQLTWQKDVSYDQRGRIVDMVKLDPTHFPTHLVRPSVSVLASDHANTRSLTRRKVKGHQPRPPRAEGTTLTPSHPHTSVRAAQRKKLEGGSKVQRSTEGVVAKESQRFPELPALPALVDTIDPRPGVTVREAGRTLQGPAPATQQRGAASPRANLHLVQPDSSTARDRGGGERGYVTCK